MPRSRTSAINSSASCNQDEETVLSNQTDEPRCHLTGGGIKPPKGAEVKSFGTERLGKDMP